MTISDLLSGFEALIALYRRELPFFVPAGGDLQSAVDSHPLVELEEGSYPQVVIAKAVTIRGNGATIIGSTGHAIHILPSTTDVHISDVTCLASWRESVVKVGANDLTQTTLSQVPSRITLANVVVPTHRGKRAFEIHGSFVSLIDCGALDVWDPSLADSQGVWICNTPGPITVSGGTFVAGSENILVGGDTTRIPGVIPTDLLFDNLMLSKPESWRTDGVARAVKNLFELKSGKNVALLNSSLSGSWKAGQDGWAIVITPRNGASIENVLIENVEVTRAAGGIQFLGLDGLAKFATKGVVVRNSSFDVTKTYGGRGILALYVSGMLDSTWENVVATFDGPQIVFCDTTVPCGPFVMKNCTLPTGTYGVMAPGVNYGGPTPVGRPPFVTTFEGNAFSGAPKQFKGFYPANTWI